ncbi:STAS domain-containing protein [Nannocystaceae bacterium ST9]
MPITSLAHSLASIVDSVSDRLSARPTSVFGRLGAERWRAYVFGLLDALARDLAAGKREVVRQATQSLIEGLSGEGLTFADLRFLAQTLRARVHEAMQDEPDAIELRPQIDEWFFELVLVLTMRFMARREEFLQARTVKLELQQLESQLGDLQSALEEKTRLLEVIRQASTPIAPVVQGILVVPLVGMFDTFRAEMLTERLLSEVSRVHARAVILDISGVPVLDTQSAQLIIRLARSVRLLGTEIFVVGMSPDNARTIVALAVDLRGLRTLGTLQDGLAQALVLQRLRIAPL